MWHPQTLFQVLDMFVAEAGKRGILIMFDLHQIDPMKGFDPVCTGLLLMLKRQAGLQLIIPKIALVRSSGTPTRSRRLT